MTNNRDYDMKGSFGVRLGFIDRAEMVDIFPRNEKNSGFLWVQGFPLSLAIHITTLKMRNKIVTHFSDPIFLKRREMFDGKIENKI